MLYTEIEAVTQIKSYVENCRCILVNECQKKVEAGWHSVCHCYA